MSKNKLILIGFILLKFVLQYVLLSPNYDLHRDEYLHLDQAKHLAWGFQSVPPVTSWISFVILQLGNSIFWVKFFPALFGALTLVVVWKTIQELGGNLYALLLGSTCVLFSALLKIDSLYQPNSFDVLSWTTLYFIILNYAKTENAKWLFVGAVVFAFGFLNKYNIAFLIVGMTPALLLSKHRMLFTEPKFYLAILLGLLLIAPNIFWQYSNDFPVVHHFKELAERQLVHVKRSEFLKGQLLFFLGSIVVILVSFYALIFYRPFKKYRFFFYSVIFTLLAFICLRAKAYYAIGIYPIYIAFGSVYLSIHLNIGWKKLLKPILIIIPILLFIPFSQVVFPNESPEILAQNSDKYKKLGMLQWEDGKEHSLPQDFADMLGWKELARKTDSIYLRLPNKEKTLILCDNYGQAGAINYYTKQNIRAVSFNADYINWFDLETKYQNLIRIKDVEGKDKELSETSPYFRTSILADSITNRYAREIGTSIFVFTDAKININNRIKKEIVERR